MFCFFVECVDDYSILQLQDLKKQFRKRERERISVYLHDSISSALTLFFSCIDCIIQYFLPERLINNSCFCNFGEPFFPPLFVFIIFSCRQHKNVCSFCSPRSIIANYSTVYSWHFVLEDALC